MTWNEWLVAAAAVVALRSDADRSPQENGEGAEYQDGSSQRWGESHGDEGHNDDSADSDNALSHVGSRWIGS